MIALIIKYVESWGKTVHYISKIIMLVISTKLVNKLG